MKDDVAPRTPAGIAFSLPIFGERSSKADLSAFNAPPLRGREHDRPGHQRPRAEIEGGVAGLGPFVAGGAHRNDVTGVPFLRRIEMATTTATTRP